MDRRHKINVYILENYAKRLEYGSPLPLFLARHLFMRAYLDISRFAWQNRMDVKLAVETAEEDFRTPNASRI